MNAPTPPSTVYNLLILDESGSMDVVRQTTVSGFNELVQTVQGLAREFPEKKQVVTLTTFNGLGINEKLFMQEASALHQLTLADYKPDSMTPLMTPRATISTRVLLTTFMITQIFSTPGLLRISFVSSFAFRTLGFPPISQ